VTSLKEYIVYEYRPRRSKLQHAGRRHVCEDADDVSVARSPGLDTASVALPVQFTHRAGCLHARPGTGEKKN